MDNTIDTNSRFCICFFTNRVFTVSLRTHSAVFFYPINLIVAQPLNKNKSQLLATFEN